MPGEHHRPHSPGTTQASDAACGEPAVCSRRRHQFDQAQPAVTRQPPPLVRGASLLCPQQCVEGGGGRVTPQLMDKKEWRVNSTYRNPEHGERAQRDVRSLLFMYQTPGCGNSGWLCLDCADTSSDTHAAHRSDTAASGYASSPPASQCIPFSHGLAPSSPLPPAGLRSARSSRSFETGMMWK